LGNSITDNAEWSELFENPLIKNRGIGGDDTDGILDRLGEVTESGPDKIFLLIGTNDLAYGKKGDYILENYKKIIESIKKNAPDCSLYIQSILPVDDALHYTRPNKEIIKINEELKLLAQEYSMTYIDIWSTFKDKNGMLDKSYSLDGLHLNGAGYEVWKKIIEKYINE